MDIGSQTGEFGITLDTITTWYGMIWYGLYGSRHHTGIRGRQYTLFDRPTTDTLLTPYTLQNLGYETKKFFERLDIVFA